MSRGRVRILGSVDAVDPAGSTVDVGGPKERTVLAVLALRPNEAVSEDALIDALWGESPPRTATKTLQAYVSRLRKVLGCEPGLVIESRRPGYVLRTEPGLLDVALVEGLVERARAGADPTEVASTLRQAEALWRGRSLGEFADEPWASAEAARLEELRLNITSDRLDAELACGRGDALVGELEALCASHPLRERLWGQRMVALYRSGRQADALAAYRQLRSTLADELGLDPGPELQELERQILAQDPTLRVDRDPEPAPSGAPLPSGVVTFLFTDVEGSSHLWEQHPDAMGDVIAQHDRTLRGAVEKRGGIVVKSTGDGLYAAFATATPAVAAAVEAQRSLIAADWSDAVDLRVRMALHSGEAEGRDGDYLGPVLNRAARLLATGHGGQILCSQVTIDLVADTASEGISFTHLGEHRLRDLARPEHVFQVAHPDLPATFPPLRSLDAQRHNLPVQTTLFVGRDDEVPRLVDALGGSHIVTLTGTGGVGKTRLAMQAAAEALPRFPHGAWLCELATVSDPDLVDVALATSLGVPPSLGRGVLDSIVDFLRHKELLLILDNCEHVLASAAEVVEAITHACSGVRVLATSREPMDVEGERSWLVRSLPVPTSADDDVSGFAAVQLFVDRAQAVRADFALTTDNAVDLSEVCRRLDGIPLAIELAAARVRSMSPAEIEERLGERFLLLTGGRRTALERHQTLRGAVDWSHELLDDSERIVFRRLAVFSGGFDLRAAEVVCGIAELSSAAVLDLLSGLVAKSMVVADETARGTRYTVLETLRQYAREQLQQAGEVVAVQAAHAEHFATRIAEAGRGLRSADEASWIDWIALEAENLRAAVGWAAECGDAGLAVRLMAPLHTFLFVESSLATELGVLAEVVAGIDGVGAEPGVDMVMLWVCMAAYNRGDLERQNDAWRTALGFARAMGRPPDPTILLAQASSTMLTGDVDAAAETLREALATARASGDPEALAFTLFSLPALWLSMGRKDAEALAVAEEAVEFHRTFGVPSMLSWALATVAWFVADDDYPRAIRLLDESIAVRFDSPWSASQTRNVTARIRAKHGDVSGAVTSYAALIEESHQTGNRGWQTNYLGGMAKVLAESGYYRDAAEIYGAINAGVVSSFGLIPVDAAPGDAVREALGDAAYAEATAVGAARSYDEVLAHVHEIAERLTVR